MVEITDTNFEELFKSGKILLDCFAPRCGPCRSLGTILENIEKNFEGIQFCKCDVDSNKKVAEHFGVKNVPMVFLLEDGVVKTSFNGIRPAGVIKNLVDENFK